LAKLTIHLAGLADIFDALGHAHQLLNALIEHRPSAEYARDLAVDLEGVTEYCFLSGGYGAPAFEDQCSDKSEVLREAHWTKVELVMEHGAKLILYADDYNDDPEEPET
jgi:hypothetical protein